MSLKQFRLVRNVGRFLSVYAAAADDPKHKTLTLIYGENGIGKTTLTAILRSLASGQPTPIEERQRLGANHPPHVVVEIDSSNDAVFQNGTWSRTYPDMLVFDDTFVNENVHSGLNVVAAQRQNLHGLILGRDGVQLVQRLDGLTETISRLQTDLRTRESRIGAALRGNLSVDEFCALPTFENIDEALAEATRTLEALEQANSVQTTGAFESFGLPLAGLESVDQALRRELGDLDATALASVTAAFRQNGARI